MGSAVPRTFAAERDCMGIIPTRVAIVEHYAPSVARFRGALIRALVQRGVQVWVLAPDFTPATRDQVAMSGGQPADYFLIVQSESFSRYP